MSASEHGDDANDTGDHDERMHLKQKIVRHCHCHVYVYIVVCIVCCPRDVVSCGVDLLQQHTFLFANAKLSCACVCIVCVPLDLFSQDLYVVLSGCT